MKTSLSPYLEQPLRDKLEKTSPTKTLWVALKRTYCAHDNDVVRWHVPECKCECDSCGHFEVNCYVRIASGPDYPSDRQLSEDNDGNLNVIEESWVSAIVRQKSYDLAIGFGCQATTRSCF